MATIYSFHAARTAMLLKNVAEQGGTIHADISSLILSVCKIGQALETASHVLNVAIDVLEQSQQAISSSRSFAGKCSTALDRKTLDEMVRARDHLMEELNFSAVRGGLLTRASLIEFG